MIKGNAGLDYGTSLYLNDNTGNFAAGRYRPTLNELDCIGLIVTKFTPTEIDFRPGSGYQQFSPKYQINDGDADRDRCQRRVEDRPRQVRNSGQQLARDSWINRRSS